MLTVNKDKNIVWSDPGVLQLSNWTPSKESTLDREDRFVWLVCHVLGFVLALLAKRARNTPFVSFYAFGA